LKWLKTGCRNPFQTRSTTSMAGLGLERADVLRVAIPSKPGQRLQYQGWICCLFRTIKLCRNPFQTRSTTSMPGATKGAPKKSALSQSLPNQVNDFNATDGKSLKYNPECRNPFQTRSTTSIDGPVVNIHSVADFVAIPSKPGQRLQFFSPLQDPLRVASVAIPSKPGQRLQSVKSRGERKTLP